MKVSRKQFIIMEKKMLFWDYHSKRPREENLTKMKGKEHKCHAIDASWSFDWQQVRIRLTYPIFY